MFSFNINTNEVEFPTSANSDHGYEAHPFPPLWPKSSHSACDTKFSSFLTPQNNQQEDKSSVLRCQAILRGKRELMELIQDVPESDYELSLKDIVQQHRPQADEQETSIEERRSKSDGRVQSTKRRIRKEESINQKKTVIRSKSMDYEAFALRTFFPFAMVISWRRSKSESRSKFSPPATVDRREYASEELRDRPPGATEGGWSKNNVRDVGRISRTKSAICSSSWWKSIFHKKEHGKKTESCSLLGSD